MTTQTVPDGGLVPEFGLADRLAKALQVANVSNQAMADYLGVSRNTISAYVNGRGTPKRAYLLLWALRTGVDREWLETGRTRRDSNPKPSDWESIAQVVTLPVWQADRQAVAS